MNQGTDATQIQNLFGSIAPTYDKVNHIMTLGMAQSWRKKLVEWSGAQEGDHVLDCATGTGDLAIHFKKAVGLSGRVIGLDFCAEMLKQAPKKSERLQYEILFDQGDVTNLSYEENSFHIAGMAYGIRNVNDAKKALSEMARVVKPNGYIMILETGKLRSPFLRIPIDFYFNHFIPRIGGWISGHREAYNYLNQSSHEFPCREEFVNFMMSTHLFRWVHYKPILGGASFMYKAEVI